MADSHCRITFAPIEPARLLKEAGSAADGAALLFTGLVRDHNEGRGVGHLEYQAYPDMAEAVLCQIVEEAQERWETGKISVVHRIGRLEIGEVSVAIVVASAHRAEVFEASRYIIEELKKRVPIWKREGYLDGATQWLAGNTPAAEGDGA